MYFFQLVLMACLVLGPSLVLKAQNNNLGDYAPMGALYFEENQTYYLLTEAVHLREKPSTQAKSLRQLPIASPVQFLGFEGNFHRSEGIEAPFAKVRVGGQIGYIWSPLLATQSIEMGRKRLVFGLDKVIPPNPKDPYATEEVHVRLRMVQDNKILAEAKWKNNGSLMNNYELEDLGQKNLRNSQSILRLHYAEPMCGGAAGVHYLNWDGQNMKPVLHTTHGSDVPYFTTCTAIFPTDKGGIAQAVKLVYESGEYNDEGEAQINNREEEIHLWNGQVFKPK